MQNKEVVLVESVGDRYKKYLEKYPFLNLPKDYFEKDDFYQTDIIKNPSYQSYPSTVITTGAWKILPNTKALSLEKVLDENRQREGKQLQGWNQSNLISTFEKYPLFAGYFLPDYEIDNIDRFDVNKDGFSEFIVYGCPAFMAGSACGRIIIVDSKGKLLFDYENRGIEIESIKNGNGFYLLAADMEEDMEATCCTRVKTKIRFVYDNNTFTPVFEQKVVYVRIGDIKDYP